MNIKKLIQDNNLEPYLVKGTFGIEKEGLRTDSKGFMSQTNHPSLFGNRNHHPYIQTDFSESQLELVTPPQNTLKQQYQWLKALHDVVNRTLSEDEFVWPFSMPNILPEEKDIPLIKVEDESEINYRKILAKKYGKKKQMISGVHYNFSLDPSLLEKMSDVIKDYSDSAEWTNDVYLKMSRNYLRYQWMLTYLFGASPVSHSSILDSESIGMVRSLRNSPYGYHNTFDDDVSYESIDGYIQDIERLVENNTLSEEREYYGSSRLRGKGKYVNQLKNNGARYVEFRSFDLNPFDSLGFSLEQSLFVHVYLLTMVWMDVDSSDKDIKMGIEMNAETALEDPFVFSQYKEEGLAILAEMKQTCLDLKMTSDYIKVIDKAVHLFNHPEDTLAANVVNTLNEKTTYIELGIELGKKYKGYSLKKPFLLNGFETMEMSSQLILFDAMQMGLETTILDANDQFLMFEYKGNKEYVRNGNMTSKDTYISHWIMANKTVTKMLLRNQGYSVPDGEDFSTIEEAKAYYEIAAKKAIVVKPKSTNYGIGISIFKQSPSREAYEEALDLAFKEDDSILVEEYIGGTEYRFFVLDEKVEAILLREPANVTGDGTHTIRELIAEKNTHPYRGENHRAPLAKITMGAIEALMLKEQGYTFDSIVENEKKVYLRENSNISTGGDSIDVTDDVHESYKSIAEEMSKALEVKVTGLDLIIPDITLPSTKENLGYTVIEANFNPAMNMHAYVQKGKGRRLSTKVLEMLYPDIELS